MRLRFAGVRRQALPAHPLLLLLQFTKLRLLRGCLGASLLQLCSLMSVFGTLPRDRELGNMTLIYEVESTAVSAVSLRRPRSAAKNSSHQFTGRDRDPNRNI
jgi:hypothetical protein